MKIHNSEQKLRSRNLCEDQYQGRKMGIVIEAVLVAQCIQAWDLKNPEDPVRVKAPSFCEYYLQELNQVLKVNIRKTPLWFWQREVKGNNFEMHQNILFFFKRPALQRN